MILHYFMKEYALLPGECHWFHNEYLALILPQGRILFFSWRSWLKNIEGLWESRKSLPNMTETWVVLKHYTKRLWIISMSRYDNRSKRLFYEYIQMSCEFSEYVIYVNPKGTKLKNTVISQLKSGLRKTMYNWFELNQYNLINAMTTSPSVYF